MPFRIKHMLPICIVVFLAAACGKDTSGDIAFERGEAPDEIFEGFITQESDSGLIRWKLTAPSAKRYVAKQIILMDKPKIEFHGSEGKLQTTLTSDYGEYYEATRDMLAYGNVVVVSVDGDVLETDSLLWVNSRNKIISNSYVKLTRGRDVITGIGLECEHDLSSVDIKRDVQATIMEKEEERTDD